MSLLMGFPLPEEEPEPQTPDVMRAREAQRKWAQTELRHRLAVLRKTRHRIGGQALELARTVPREQPGALHRSYADTLVAEVLPLAEACRFLEREAAAILARQCVVTTSRPAWLRGVTTEIHRDPLGLILVVAPANYPLFLPGVQVLQALAAGNAVWWKPAPGGGAAAEALRELLVESGLDPALLVILDDSAEAASAAIYAGVDKVFFTGSSTSGRAVSQQLADHATPSVMELSGCDAVFVLPDADQERTIDALAFGLRLNGSATCMAPRRLFLVGDNSPRGSNFIARLLDKLQTLPTVPLSLATETLLSDLLENAKQRGGAIIVDRTEDSLRCVVLLNATPAMRIACTDIFAPVLSIFPMPDEREAIAAYEQCPFALTASIFGPERKARALGARITAGVVLINDLIVATADPRVSFGGRKSSGYGVTRGREGLLEMTAPKTILVQRGRSRRAYQPTTPEHEDFFCGYMKLAHGGGVRARMQGIRQFLRAASKLK